MYYRIYKRWHVGSTPQIDLQIQCNSYQNSNCLICRYGQTDANINIELPGTTNSHKKKKLKNKVRGIILFDFKDYYKAIAVIKTLA